MEHSEDQDKPAGKQLLASSNDFIPSSLQDLQSDEQSQFLDTVAQLRNCGLDSILSLPQLVVCGDQSAGKSSVLEALTEIPFPRNDNLCTRYATEIILRRSSANTLTIKVIPDAFRPPTEQEKIKFFTETITDFGDLPRVMRLATEVMGISEKDEFGNNKNAFARDTLSIEIEGPSRPQLTLVDIPGLIQTSTKGVSDADVDLVTSITRKYIQQPRTICLAVVSATNDAANQPILREVRVFDPEGNRTLGIITKPDRLSPNSGMEGKFLELARNEDVRFRLGWHVLKNRSFEQGDCSLEERNSAESTFFAISNFKSLPADQVGVDALRSRLSQLLFQHIKQELPQLRQELETTLKDTKKSVAVLGSSRTNLLGCRTYLLNLSLEYRDICTAAVGGHYDHGFFEPTINVPFDLESSSTIARLRAVVQYLNTHFSETIRTKGHKFHIDQDAVDDNPEDKDIELDSTGPIVLSNAKAMKWVRQVMIRTRGTELVGNFNPQLINALFWEQSSAWEDFALGHIETVLRICRRFLDHLFDTKAPKEVKSRLWATKIEAALENRRKSAIRELDLLVVDLKSFQINYNHYYTDTVQKKRTDREEPDLQAAVKAGTFDNYIPCTTCKKHNVKTERADAKAISQHFHLKVNSNMEQVGCGDALDCLFAIYKVQQKTFVANITTQVIERHIIRDLREIFSPTVVATMSDSEIEAVAKEPTATRIKRTDLEKMLMVLEEGKKIFGRVL